MMKKLLSEGKMRYEYKSIKFCAGRRRAQSRRDTARRNRIANGIYAANDRLWKADISLIADPNGLRDGYKIEQSGSRLVSGHKVYAD